ncbi:MAG: hypothetical protein Kow006_12620 [Gammaproteobacteria bacterium]
MRHFDTFISPLRLAVFALSGLLLAGCVNLGGGTKTTVTSSSGQDINQARAESYNGPKARIAVARFTDKTGGGWYNRSIGDGMADQLTTALVQTNRFIVLERQALGDIISEQDLGGAGRIKKGTEAKIGEMEGAEILVVAAVTEFEGNAGGTKARVGGGGGGLLGAIFGGMRKAHIAIDLRLVDATSSRVLYATSVEGESTDVDVGGALGSYFGGGALGGALSSWKNTPLEKALRQVINAAVQEVIKNTPQEFYRHGAAARPVSSAVLSREEIRTAQTRLNRLGYEAGAADGLMGRKTREAIRGFQADNKLPVTGNLDSQTLDALRRMTQ